MTHFRDTENPIWAAVRELTRLDFRHPARAGHMDALWDLAVEEDVKDGVGLLVPLERPVMTERGLGRWLFISFYGFLEDPAHPHTMSNDGNHGWLPSRHAPALPITAVSDRNHCLGIDRGGGQRTWVQLAESVGEDGNPAPIPGVIDGPTNGRLMDQAEGIVEGLVRASNEKLKS